VIALVILSRIRRPSSTACTTVAKLSSARTISAAPFATSVPTTPIAAPISDFFKAGASLTPSPVIATISPCFFHASMIRILCSGDTRAYTAILLTCLNNSSSLIKSSSVPVTTLSPGNINPICKPIASAVVLWSPVIIIGRIPAVLHSSIASFTSSRGGSIIPVSPTKQSCDSTLTSPSLMFS